MGAVRKFVVTAVACSAVAGMSTVALAAPGGKDAGGDGVSSITLQAPVVALDATTADSTSSALRVGDVVSYATTIEPLKGYEWPMVSTRCSAPDGSTLWAQLDYPDAAFTLGGVWSPWHDAGGEGNCEAVLWAYSNKGGHYTARLLAWTPPFVVSG